MPKLSIVTRLSDLNNNSLSVSPSQSIEDLQEFLSENPKFDKVFLIALNNYDQEFKYTWFKGQMLCSEAIALLNLASKDQLETLT